MFLTLHLCRRNTFSWLFSCSVCPWDIEFSLGRHKMLVKRAIRLPNMFWSHNIVFKGKSQAKVMYFIKLAILTFRCPKDMYIPNFTRIPLEFLVLEMPNNSKTDEFSEKFQTAFGPPPSFSENHIAIFSKFINEVS